jgi:hypothetical protein
VLESSAVQTINRCLQAIAAATPNLQTQCTPNSPEERAEESKITEKIDELPHHVNNVNIRRPNFSPKP